MIEKQLTEMRVISQEMCAKTAGIQNTKGRKVIVSLIVLALNLKFSLIKVNNY